MYIIMSLHKVLGTLDIDIIKKTIDNGADINELDKNNDTPLFVSLLYFNNPGASDISQYLIECGCDINNNKDILSYAIENEYIELVNYLCRNKIYNNNIDYIYMCLQLGYQDSPNIYIFRILIYYNFYISKDTEKILTVLREYAMLNDEYNIACRLIPIKKQILIDIVRYYYIYILYKNVIRELNILPNSIYVKNMLSKYNAFKFN